MELSGIHYEKPLNSGGFQGAVGAAILSYWQWRSKEFATGAA